MRVRFEGLRLVDLSVCLPRGPIACHARVGAWLAKEELAVGLFMTSELWHWSSVARGSLMQTALEPSTPLGCRQFLVLICRVVYFVLHCNSVYLVMNIQCE